MHPHIAEAEKRLQIAKDQYGKAVEAIDRQYLKPVIAEGSAEGIAAANRLRKTFVDVADVATVDAGRAAEQPAGDAPPPAPKKAPKAAKSGKK